MQIRAGRSNTKMVGMARANFPQVPEFPPRRAVTLPVASLRNMIVEDDLRHLERGVALHAEWRAAGAEGRNRWRWWRPMATGWRISRSRARPSTGISAARRRR